jgi:DNA-directed RNA polymerase subunit M/transcription elongation factor TFIIS
MERRFKFACACGQHLVARESMVGTKVHCPSCQQEVTIPPSGDAVDESQYQKAERFPVVCPCGQRMLVKLEAAGQTVHCPGCRRAIKLPTESQLRGKVKPGLEERRVAREQIHTEDLLLLVDDEEGPGSEIK